jgi:hypothetical protein
VLGGQNRVAMVMGRDLHTTAPLVNLILKAAKWVMPDSGQDYEALASRVKRISVLNLFLARLFPIA